MTAEGVRTEFGSLEDFRKGVVEIIDDDPRNYVFSNIFEVAAAAAPFERVAVAKNFEYVIEAMRAEGRSSWFTCTHDEFALCMDGEVEIRFVKLAPGQVPDEAAEGAQIVSDEVPAGTAMGRVMLGRGHMALLPLGAAYSFAASKPAALLIQTIEGGLTLQRWAEICQTQA